jgi:hypothetical protein
VAFDAGDDATYLTRADNIRTYILCMVARQSMVVIGDI